MRQPIGLSLGSSSVKCSSYNLLHAHVKVEQGNKHEKLNTANRYSNLLGHNSNLLGHNYVPIIRKHVSFRAET